MKAEKPAKFRPKDPSWDTCPACGMNDGGLPVGNTDTLEALVAAAIIIACTPIVVTIVAGAILLLVLCVAVCLLAGLTLVAAVAVFLVAALAVVTEDV